MQKTLKVKSANRDYLWLFSPFQIYFTGKSYITGALGFDDDIFSTVILLIRSVLHVPNVLPVQFYQDFGQSLCLIQSIGSSFFQVSSVYGSGFQTLERPNGIKIKNLDCGQLDCISDNICSIVQQ